ERLGRNIFPIEGHDIDESRKFLERGAIREIALRVGCRDRQRGFVAAGAENMATIAEARGSLHRHARELPAAQNADRRSRGSDPLFFRLIFLSDGFLAMDAVCAARQMRHLRAIFLSSSPKIETASRPAFKAPACPIAKVPTGTPGGICAIDKRLSRPS